MRYISDNVFEIITSTASSPGLAPYLIAGSRYQYVPGEIARGYAGNILTGYDVAQEGITPKGIGDDVIRLGTDVLHDIDAWIDTWYQMLQQLIGIDGTDTEEKRYVGIDATAFDATSSTVKDLAQALAQAGVLAPATDIPLGKTYADSLAQPAIIDWSTVINPAITIPSILTPSIAITADPNPEATPSVVIPELPTITAKRLYTVHKMSQTELDLLGAYLWSADFLSLIEKMFTQPIDAVIGLHTLYHSGLPLGSSEAIKLGSVTATGCTGTLVTNQYCQVDCGSVSIPEFYGNVEDYQPYTKAEIFLPFCGFKELDVNDIMGGSVYVKYKIDIFTGACVATIGVMRDGVSQALYAFEGNCAVQQPVTSADYSRIVSGLLTVAAGVATGGTGAAVLGAGALLSGAHRISYPRSGTVGANIGACLPKTPYILVRRPLAFNASNYQNYYGYPSKWTVTLGSCHGFTKAEVVHLDQIACTDDEKAEILQLLKEGVIL